MDGRVLAAARMVVAFLGFSALVTEVATLAERDSFHAARFFSFFTVESNMLAVLSLVLGAFPAVTGGGGPRLNYVRGGIALAMTTVILVFVVLLSGYPSKDLTAVPWDNTVLHYLMPVAVMLDWVVPGRSQPVRFRAALWWLAFPLAFLVYSLVRGHLVHWYPYPFLDPSQHGYAGVLGTSAVIAVVLAALAWLVARAPGWAGRGRRPAVTVPGDVALSRPARRR